VTERFAYKELKGNERTMARVYRQILSDRDVLVE